MTKKKLYTLSKNERLKSRKMIEQLFKEGKSFSIFPIKIFYLKAESDISLKAGFTVGTKHFKKAVDRNRIKRQMRESYRLQKNDLKEHLIHLQQSIVLFFIYLGNELPEYNLIKEKMNTGLKRVKKLIDENNLDNT